MRKVAISLSISALLSGAGTAAAKPDAPVSIIPPAAQATPAPPVSVTPPYPVTDQNIVTPPPPLPVWKLADAQALQKATADAAREGLFPGDYEPDALAAAIKAGEGEALNAVATRIFRNLAQDYRDGRTPYEARVQWFVRDPDSKALPTDGLIAKALETRDVAGVLNGLLPAHADYAALKAALAATPDSALQKRQAIRANMERWRWLPQDLGFRYVIANVPEFQLRFMVNAKQVRSFKAVVGKPGATATPQLAEMAQGVVFNPTWTVPQSIIKNELMGRVGAGKSGVSGEYKWWRDAKGTVSMVQQAGPNNSLGLMKVDMPNPHAIFVHDTPARQRFNQPMRALSHGCVRAERAWELGMMLAAIFGDISVDEGAAIIKSGETTKVPFKETVPVYIAYFTMGTGLDGKMQSFADIYGRDAPVFASLSKPRVTRAESAVQTEKVKEFKNPGI